MFHSSFNKVHWLDSSTGRSSCSGGGVFCNCVICAYVLSHGSVTGLAITRFYIHLIKRVKLPLCVTKLEFPKVTNKPAPLGYSAHFSLQYVSTHKNIKIKSTLQSKGKGGGHMWVRCIQLGWCLRACSQTVSSNVRCSLFGGAVRESRGGQASGVRERRIRGGSSRLEDKKKRWGKKKQGHTFPTYWGWLRLPPPPPPLRLCHPACPLLRRHIWSSLSSFL